MSQKLRNGLKGLSIRNRFISIIILLILFHGCKPKLYLMDCFVSSKISHSNKNNVSFQIVGENSIFNFLEINTDISCNIENSSSNVIFLNKEITAKSNIYDYKHIGTHFYNDFSKINDFDSSDFFTIHPMEKRMIKLFFHDKLNSEINLEEWKKNGEKEIIEIIDLYYFKGDDRSDTIRVNNIKLKPCLETIIDR